MTFTGCSMDAEAGAVESALSNLRTVNDGGSGPNRACRGTSQPAAAMSIGWRLRSLQRLKPLKIDWFYQASAKRLGMLKRELSHRFNIVSMDFLRSAKLCS